MHIDQFKPLELEHKPVLDSLLARSGVEVSEINFSNLYMWKQQKNPVFIVESNCLSIIYRPINGKPYALAPVGSGDKYAASLEILDILRELGVEPALHRAGQAFVDNMPASLSATPDPDNSDYVYKAADMAELKGKPYHKKKNHVNRFKKEYRFEHKAMDAALVEKALDMQERWCTFRGCEDDPGLAGEDIAVRSLLENFEAFGLMGSALLIDDEVEAFSLGEKINDDTAVVHVEKANTSLHGIYAAMTHYFAVMAREHVTYLNREQDLGIEGLRRAKQSWRPDHMVDKYIIRPA